jgi:hypothetical protein
LGVGSVPSWHLVVLLHWMKQHQVSSIGLCVKYAIVFAICQVTFNDSRCYMISNSLKNEVQTVPCKTKELLDKGGSTLFFDYLRNSLDNIVCKQQSADFCYSVEVCWILQKNSY